MSQSKLESTKVYLTPEPTMFYHFLPMISQEATEPKDNNQVTYLLLHLLHLFFSIYPKIISQPFSTKQWTLFHLFYIC